MCPSNRGGCMAAEFFSLKTQGLFYRAMLASFVRWCGVGRRNTGLGVRFSILTLVLLLLSCVSFGTSFNLSEPQFS